jgi:hypothetical protein
MHRKPLRPIEDFPKFMDLILLSLNSAPHENWPVDRAEIRRLVNVWQDSGRDARKTLKRLQDLKPYNFNEDGNLSCQATLFPVGSGLQTVPLAPPPATSLEERLKEVSGNPPGAFFMTCNTPQPSVEEWLVDQARRDFIRLLLHPLREKLSDRPCARCDRYFLKKTARQTEYCSRKCSRDGTAAFATKKRLRDQHSRKLTVAAELAQKWITVRTKDDWKQWVAKHPRGVREEITPKFLTRAVNKGGLMPPKKGK